MQKYPYTKLKVGKLLRRRCSLLTRVILGVLLVGFVLYLCANYRKCDTPDCPCSSNSKITIDSMTRGLIRTHGYPKTTLSGTRHLVAKTGVTGHLTRTYAYPSPGLDCKFIATNRSILPAVLGDPTKAMADYGIPIDFFLQEEFNSALDEFRLVRRPTGLCKGPVALLVLILGAVDNVQMRMSHRETWANVTKVNGGKIEFAFVHGRTLDKNAEISLAMESNVFDDIIQFDFIDSYRNLTMKTILSFRWTLKYCPQATFVVRTMDDVIINLFQLLSILEDAVPPKLLYHGCGIVGGDILHGGKYDFWSNVPFSPRKATKYAPYISGTAITMTMDVIRMFYAQSCVSPIVWPDDGYLGYLSLVLGIPLRSDLKFCREALFHFYVSDKTPRKIRIAWKMINKQRGEFSNARITTNRYAATLGI